MGIRLPLKTCLKVSRSQTQMPVGRGLGQTPPAERRSGIRAAVPWAPQPPLHLPSSAAAAPTHLWVRMTKGQGWLPVQFPFYLQKHTYLQKWGEFADPW